MSDTYTPRTVRIGRTDYVTATEAAKVIGVARDTFTSYVSRGQAPAPAVDAGTKLYKLADILKWHQGRRSQAGGTR